MDLAFTLFPYGAYPDHYDLTVDGVVAGAGLDPATVYGAWSIDAHSCAAEPASGSLVIRSDTPYGLDFDGALACDSCAALALEGLPAGQACTPWLLPQ